MPQDFDTDSLDEYYWIVMTCQYPDIPGQFERTPKHGDTLFSVLFFGA